MSKENLEQFISKVANSEELQANIGDWNIETEKLIALGAECGCEFTADELMESAEWGRRWGRKTWWQAHALRKFGGNKYMIHIGHHFWCKCGS